MERKFFKGPQTRKLILILNMMSKTLLRIKEGQYKTFQTIIQQKAAMEFQHCLKKIILTIFNQIRFINLKPLIYYSLVNSSQTLSISKRFLVEERSVTQD
jgi:hypothetical protein